MNVKTGIMAGWDDGHDYTRDVRLKGAKIMEN